MQNTQAGWGWSNRNIYANNNTSNNTNSRYNNKLSSSNSDGNLRYPAADKNDTRKVDTAVRSNNNHGSVYISANTTTCMDSMTISESVAVTYPSVVTVAPVLEEPILALTISSDSPTTAQSSSNKNKNSSFSNRNNVSNGQHYNSNSPHSSNPFRNKNKKNKRGVVRSAHSHWGINRPYKQPGQVYMNNHHQPGSGHKDSHEQH